MRRMERKIKVGIKEQRRSREDKYEYNDKSKKEVSF